MTFDPTYEENRFSRAESNTESEYDLNDESEGYLEKALDKAFEVLTGESLNRPPTYSIYEVGETDWIMAESEEKAVEIAMNLLGYKDKESFFEDLEVKLVPDAELDRLKYYTGPEFTGEAITFREQMQRVISSGGDCDHWFATSEC